MLEAVAAEKVLDDDETAVNVLDKAAQRAAREAGGEKDEEETEKAPSGGAPHALIVCTADGRLTWLQAIASRRKESVGGGISALFTGHLITDGYTGYQHLLERLAGIEQCCQHDNRRCRAVTRLGGGGLQSWAGDNNANLREAHKAVDQTGAGGSTALECRY